MGLSTGLQGAHVLVTGMYSFSLSNRISITNTSKGGSRGIGQSMVQSFLSEGASVSYCARTVTGTEYDEFIKSLSPETKVRASGTAIDVGSKDAIDAWVQKAAAEFGRIDTIVANASLMRFENTPQAWQESFAVDVMGFAGLVTAAQPYLEKSPIASIIVMSTFQAREFYRAPPAPYGPLKAAQLQHVQELSHFLGPKGIRVNAISPGPILCKDGPWDKFMKEIPDWVEEQRLKIPLKRLGGGPEVANVATFLASPLSSFVTGTNILVDGGIHIGTVF